jgi:hypothetical protein
VGSWARSFVAVLLAAFGSILWPEPVGAEEGRGDFCDQVAELFDGRRITPEDVPGGSIIGRVELRVLDVFDATRDAKSRLPYRIANRLHVNTRPTVIERELLFESGDPFDARTLEESERHLRAQTGIYDACIAPLRVYGGTVDVLVVTRDVWTLAVGGGFGRSGQANTVQFGLEDANFLGTGRLVDLKYTDDPDRTERRFRYQDPALFGTRAELAVKLAERSDGYRYTIDAVRPFFSFDTRWSAGTRWVSDESRVKLYSKGVVTDHFMMDQTFLEVRGGLSGGFDGTAAHRFLTGFTWDQREFSDDPGFLLPDARSIHRPVPRQLLDRLPPMLAAPPARRTVAYPWIGYQWVEDGFVERHNMNRLARTEDWNLGNQLSLRAGWSSPSWGADSSQAVAALDWSRGIATPGERHVVLLDAYGGGRFGNGPPENLIGGARVRHYFSSFGRHQLWTSVALDAARNLDPENQLLLGGDNGLRGYPLRYRDGDRRALATIEQRFYTNLEVLKLFHVGAAVFVDAGRAWYSGARPDDAGEILRDVGVGLRLGSSRSSKGTMIHLDVAFPLDGESSERRGVQWLVKTKESF